MDKLSLQDGSRHSINSTKTTIIYADMCNINVCCLQSSIQNTSGGKSISDWSVASLHKHMHSALDLTYSNMLSELQQCTLDSHSDHRLFGVE